MNKTETAIISALSTLAILLCLMFGVLTLSIPASQANAAEQKSREEIQHYILEKMSNEKIPGLATAVVTEDEIVCINGFGVTNVKGNDPVTPYTLFDLASCSKSFTALGVLLLEDRNLIEIDVPVRTYLPELVFADEEDGAEITVKQLLNHTSGLPGVFSEPLAFHSGDDAMEKLIDSMRKVHLNRPPGSSFEYSNMNYSLLGALIERISGLKFEDYMKQQIFAPLGMNHTTLYPEVAESLGKASGHQLMFGRVVPRDIRIYRSAAPVGWVMSCAADMAIWSEVQLNEGRLDGKQVIPADVIRKSHERSVTFNQNEMTESYGLGWLIADMDDGTRIIWHGGDTPNFICEMILIPEYHTGIVMLVNGQTSGSIHDIAMDILNMEIGEELAIPDAPWWASWEGIDQIATWTLGLSFLFFIGLIVFIWKQVRRRNDYKQAVHAYRIWRIVLPSAPFAILGTGILSIFLTVQFLLGYNIFRIFNRFGEYAPPGVSIAAIILFVLLSLWAIALLGLAIIRAISHRRHVKTLS